MGTITATSLIGKAQLLSQDVGAVRWAVSEWLSWLNDGQRETVIVKPTAFTKLTPHVLVAGTKQVLPADGVEFIRATRNLGTAGTTPGAAIRRATARLLDAHVPNWHASAPVASIQHFLFDPTLPKTFHVYPPSNATTQIEIEYAATPPDVASVGNPISLDDIYANVLLDYMLYRAYLKDAEVIGNAERALLHFKSFEKSLGVKTAADATT